MAYPTLQLRRHSRRHFCLGAASLFLSHSFPLSSQRAAGTGTPTRPNLAEIDRDRILAAADHCLTRTIATITACRCPRSPGSLHDYYSERMPGASAPEDPPDPSLFQAHRDAVFQLGLAVPALTAAYLLTHQLRYADHAALHLRAWFVAPATHMAPSLDYAQSVPPSIPPASSINSTPAPGHYTGILETLPLIEVAQSIPFVTASGVLTGDDAAALKQWFATYHNWLTQQDIEHMASIARDHKDHHAMSWLLQASAYASVAVPVGDAARSEDNALSALRHRYKSVTLRSQLNADGMFKNELQSQNPYRDSLFSLDMLAAVCQLLSTRFDSLWNYQLQDGVGMRSAIAYHFPFIANRAMWPFRADAHHFQELPGRRASLLFTATPYQRPEYAELWKSLMPDPPSIEVLRTVPVHQPLLWITKPSSNWPASSS